MTPKHLQAPARPLDAVDDAILRELEEHGRITNHELAGRVGVAPSTCLGRVRELQRRGVIRGIHADVDPAAVGLGLQAMIAVRLRAHVREQVEAFRASAPGLPGVLALFHVSGADDYLLHVALPSADALRDFVLDHLTGHPAVGHTETSVIFEHVRSPGVVAGLAAVTQAREAASEGPSASASGGSASSAVASGGRSRPAAKPSR